MAKRNFNLKLNGMLLSTAALFSLTSLTTNVQAEENIQGQTEDVSATYQNSLDNLDVNQDQAGEEVSAGEEGTTIQLMSAFSTESATDEGSDGGQSGITTFSVSSRAAANPTQQSPQVNRVYGSNRYRNAVEIAKEGWSQADRVYLASGEVYSDALTGTPLASLHDAPILLTKNNEIAPEAIQALQQLKTKEIVILGGKLSISDQVRQEIEKTGVEVTRLAGQNRYEQAAKVADQIIEHNNAKEPGVKKPAYVASGEVFSDALSIAPIAAKQGLPIYLTRGNRINEHLVHAASKVSKFIIIGGTKTISQGVEDALKALGVPVERISGRSRYDVNRNLIDRYNEGQKTQHAYVVSGEIFSDALPASVLAAKKDSALLLMKSDNAPTVNAQLNFAKKENLKKFTFIGGKLTLSDKTFEAFKEGEYKTPGSVSINTPPAKNNPSQSIPNRKYPTVRNVIYSPKAGENLSEIARHFGSSVDAIMRNNNLRSSVIYEGQTLYIPATTAKPMDLPRSYDGRQVVYLDPGHGGSDPGAVAYGDRESDMNLNLAFLLKAELERRGYEVVMARYSDHDATLLDRAAHANKSAADIFISLHHNAMGTPEVGEGIETYYYEYVKGWHPVLNSYDNNKQRITNSAYLGQMIQNNLIKNTGAVNRGLKTQTFQVLRETMIPSVLIEYGFINTKYENDRLGNPAYQRKLTLGVADAVDTYFKTVHL